MRISKLATPLLLALALPAWADSVTLNNGNVLTGEIVEQTDTGIVLDHPQLGRLQIAADQYSDSSVGGDGDPGAGVVADSAVPQAPEPTARRGLFGTRILRGWKNTFGAGLSGSLGGFEDTKLNAIFKTEIENEVRRWDFDSAYFLNVTPKRDQNDTTTVSKNQGFAQLRRKWYFPESPHFSRWFAVARTRYDYDEFQPWKHRIAASAGPGYRLLETEKWNLSANGGLGLSQTFGSAKVLAPEATFGFDLSWQPNSWNRVTTSNQFYLDVTDSDRYRTVQNLDWTLDLGDPGGLGFRLGLLYQFDTESTGKVNDLTYLSSLTYDF